MWFFLSPGNEFLFSSFSFLPSIYLHSTLATGGADRGDADALVYELRTECAARAPVVVSCGDLRAGDVLQTQPGAAARPSSVFFVVVVVGQHGVLS